MPYDRPITRANPGCLVVLVDQSRSMLDAMAGSGGQAKCAYLAEAVNGMLGSLIERCTVGSSSEMGVRDYFHVALVGYGQGAPSEVGSAWAGNLKGKGLVPLSEVAENADEYTQGPEGTQIGVYLRPSAVSGTPMPEGLTHVYGLVEPWTRDHSNSYPPIVLHVTDGESTSGDPEPPAARLRTLRTDDGELLLFNCHLSNRDTSVVMWPRESGDVQVNDPFAMPLFNMSSVLPPKMVASAREGGYPNVEDGSRGYVFNAGMAQLAEFLDIGTRVEVR